MSIPTAANCRYRAARPLASGLTALLVIGILLGGLELHAIPHEAGSIREPVAVFPAAGHPGESAHFEETGQPVFYTCLACVLLKNSGGLVSSAPPLGQVSRSRALRPTSSSSLRDPDLFLCGPRAPPGV